VSVHVLNELIFLVSLSVKVTGVNAQTYMAFELVLFFRLLYQFNNASRIQCRKISAGLCYGFW